MYNSRLHVVVTEVSNHSVFILGTDMYTVSNLSNNLIVGAGEYEFAGVNSCRLNYWQFLYTLFGDNCKTLAHFCLLTHFGLVFIFENENREILVRQLIGCISNVRN
jgi:hypothetical protein